MAKREIRWPNLGKCVTEIGQTKKAMNSQDIQECHDQLPLKDFWSQK